MSLDPLSESNIRLRSLFETALKEYEKKAGTILLDNPLTIKLQNCNSAEAINDVLQEQAEAFHEFRGNDEKFAKWLKRTVHVLHTLSTSSVLGEGVGLPFPPTKAIFAGIGILLAAIKDVSASYDALVDLFESTENFLRRLDIYTKIPSTEAMTEIIVKILVELLSTLALATQQVKQGRFKKFGMKLLGENETEAVLQRLDRLNHEEARTTAAQTLEVVYGLVKNMKVVMDGGKTTSEDIKQALVVMQQIASNMNKSQRDQLHDKSRKWLSPADPSTNYNIACKAHHDGTATWFIQGTTFREWEVTGSLLWIHGRPGSGKSILWYTLHWLYSFLLIDTRISSSIVRKITRLCDAGLASMAYFYFDFKDTAKQDARAALSSLLIQLCNQSDPCSDILDHLFSAHSSGGTQPSDDTLVGCLRDMLALPRNGPTYIILDAVDECPKSAGTPSPRESVLELVEWLTKLGYPNLHVCVTSRPEADIKVNLQPLASHCVSLHGESGQREDINDYIVSFTNTDTYMRKWKQGEKDLVIKRLTRDADGMFRWVFCQLDRLRRCLPSRIRRALEELPSTLDATYERTLLDIDEENWAFAHRLFQCITVASRPLRVEELAEFLAFDFDGDDNNLKFDADWRPDDPDHAVLSTCSSLISVVNVEGAPVVQFSHFSVKEFLTSGRIARGRISRFHIPLEPAHLMIARACLALLLQLDGSVNKATIENFPLAFYAARYWVGHAKFGNVTSHVQDAIRRVFDPTEPYFSVWSWLRDCDRNRESISETPSTPKAPPLHCSAQYGLSDVAEWLITSRSQHPDGLDSSTKTPLYVASAAENLKVAQVLIKHGADVNSMRTPNHRPLHMASFTGRLEILRLLVASGADVNAREDDWTPIHWASYRGHLEVVRFLIENGADPNVWLYNKTALYLALERDHSEVAQLLLKYGADINAIGASGETLLHLASRRVDLNIARQLLERGANIHAKNRKGKTALQVAETRGNQDMIVDVSHPS
ncbi:hypothetical protein EDB83DRAFT_38370 [Lactarius deliciosus]|nr:hypothetical protein EDB83DRAFT_38370 [Lactarius deliciosus]